MSTRVLAFVLICGAALAAAGAYLFTAARRTPPPVADAAAAPSLIAPGEPMGSGPMVLFRRTSTDQVNGFLGVAPLDDRSATRYVSELRCERVHMAAGRGVCLASKGRGVARYHAVIFDDTFTTHGSLDVQGVPSRVQVASTGKTAAVTVFVTGHSYADGGFSTRTSIVDLEGARFVAEDLETFTVTRGRETLQSIDFNFWGVTFTRDPNVFYATLGTRTETFLVRGDVAARRVEIIADEVECPSLSPDGRRIAFKHRVDAGIGRVAWNVWVLDLASRERHAISETRSVDDQVQWLDDEHLLYALPRDEGGSPVMNEWMAAADGSGTPELYLEGAYSATVVRP